jgi:hypothetical protein
MPTALTRCLSSRISSFLALFFVVLIIGFVFYDLGIPVDLRSWIGISIGIVPILTAWRRPCFLIPIVPLTFLYYLTFFTPLQRNLLQDVHGGRYGWEILPHGFRFAHTGRNTRLLQTYLGPLDAQWEQRCIDFMLLGDWRDGNERVNCHNLIFSRDLAAILERLPSDAARREVLMSLTDSANLLRIHQGLLLTCLKELGYPPGMNSQTWWDKHAWLFQPEHDPTRAVRIVYGWSARLREYSNIDAISGQLAGVNYQEIGTWGGDRNFGDEFLKVEEQLQRGRSKKELAIGLNYIDWWPK